MNRTRIEWCDYTWNPITGCLRGCPYCYARKLARRFGGTPEEKAFKPAFHPERLEEPGKTKKPSRIFVCSVSDLFGICVAEEWTEQVFSAMWDAPQHTYQILTKRVHMMVMWNSCILQNAWLGVTSTGNRAGDLRIEILQKEVEAQTKFVSFEPLLELPVLQGLEGIDWIIIGAQTNPVRRPPLEWVQYLIDAAREAQCAVFLKDNLRWPERIQEFPI